MGKNVRLKPANDEPERHLPEPLVEEASEQLGPPVEEPAHDREHRAAEEHVVEVPDHELRVGQLPVDRECREVDAGEPAEGEDRQEAEREQHRRVEA